MLVRFTKQAPAATVDTLTCVRPDGSATSQSLPRRGVLPHDAIHFVVETTLGWHDALFGQVAHGGTLEDVADRLHGRGREWSKMTQGLQAEALVECLEAELWAGPADPLSFAQNLIAASRRRGVTPPDIMPDEIERVRHALRDFGAAWRPLAPETSLERTFGT